MTNEHLSCCNDPFNQEQNITTTTTIITDSLPVKAIVFGLGTQKLPLSLSLPATSRKTVSNSRNQGDAKI